MLVTFKKKFIAVAFLPLFFPIGGQATTLNRDFGIPIWRDNSLWDDDARSAAGRLGLNSTKSREGTETYRSGFAGKTMVLGQPLYAMDLYHQDGKVNRLILGFINDADYHAVHGVPLPNLSANKKEVFDSLRITLTKRLGRPSGEGDTLYWSWLSHTLSLQNNEKAVLLVITPGKYHPTPNRSNSIISDKKRAATPPARYVKRETNGDVYISGIPKISQGNRGYCVPATWEKVLRHNGLDFNVYDLAAEGDTRITGSSFSLFTSRMKGMLQPHKYKVEYLRFTPDDLKSVSSYIDKGLPLVWCMDAQNLRMWVARNRTRRSNLPDETANPDLPGQYAGHALLIIGYNIREQELALSDSTELGSSESAIWIHVSEANTAHSRQTELVAIIPPGKSGSQDFLKAKWY